LKKKEERRKENNINKNLKIEARIGEEEQKITKFITISMTATTSYYRLSNSAKIVKDQIKQHLFVSRN